MFLKLKYKRNKGELQICQLKWYRHHNMWLLVSNTSVSIAISLLHKETLGYRCLEDFCGAILCAVPPLVLTDALSLGAPPDNCVYSESPTSTLVVWFPSGELRRMWSHCRNLSSLSSSRKFDLLKIKVFKTRQVKLIN